MPFSETKSHNEQYWKNHFEKFLKPMVEQTGFLEAYRSEPLRGDLLRTIITNLIKAHIVVADITDSNPNVFWELGVRQSFKNGTITIAEFGTQIPFDLSIKGVLWYYPQDHIKNSEFVQQFNKAVSDFKTNPNSPDSQVLDTISGRGSFYEILQKDEAIRRIDALIEETEYNKVIAKMAKEGIEKKEGVGNLLFQVCSLELLVTQRYLDQPSTFYGKARTHLMSLLFDNSSFELCGEEPEKMIKLYTPKSGEPWQELFEATTTKRFDLLISELTSIKAKIEGSY